MFLLTLLNLCIKLFKNIMFIEQAAINIIYFKGIYALIVNKMFIKCL